MIIPFTFSKYIVRVFLFWIGVVSVSFLSILYLFEAVEIFRRSLSKPDVSFSLAFQMAFLKVPEVYELLLPLIILFSLFLVFRRFQKNFELVIAYASGFSLYQIIFPFIAAGVFVSLIDLFVLNPLSAGFFARYQSLNMQYLKKQKSQITLSDTGLWLRQEDTNGYILIRAAAVNIPKRTFSNVTFYLFENPDIFKERLDARVALIHPGYWELSNVFQHSKDQKIKFFPSQAIQSSFSFEKIEDHFLPPKSLSFWNLPQFIHNLEKTGFSGTSHRIYWYGILFRPLAILGMILSAACFGIQWQRQGGQIKNFSGTLLTGFIYYFTNDLMQTLSASHVIPPFLGLALSPCLLIIISSIYLLHLNHFKR